MRHEKIMNVQDILQSSPFNQIMKKGLMVHDLNLQIEQLFPSQFKGLYRVTNIEGEKLFFEVANAIVRQGLLFKQQQLLSLAKIINPKVNCLVFNINPSLVKNNLNM
ncbi:DciA family protein [Seminibacterium arietis]|uniref:DciA family protein n=1 Tax=Seminibacterium arietis TaxID=1173502 RepID=A0ABW3I9P7_9PAST